MTITKRDEDFLRGLRGGSHWSEDDARRAIALCEASGQSRAAFARTHGLRATRFAWWKKRLAEWTADAECDDADERDGEFVELVVGASHAAMAAATVRVGDVIVELATLDAAAAEFISVLARALQSDACS